MSNNKKTPLVKRKAASKSKKAKDQIKDSMISKLDYDTDIKEALKVIQYYILNPNHVHAYSVLTYIDEVVLLCLLKGVEVVYNTHDEEYYIDGQLVSSSIDKLIEKGYISHDTLTPRKLALKRVYVSHPFSDKSKLISKDSFRNFIQHYYVVEDFKQARSKWMGKNFIYTIYNAMVTPRFEEERISFSTFINIAANLEREYKEEDKDTKPRCELFDFNIKRLETITNVLLEDIRSHLN